MAAMRASDDHRLLRVGSSAAILGALAAGVGNLLHPITPRDDPSGVARVIADSELWTPIHLVIVVGIILLPVGLFALRHSLAGDGATDTLTRLGMYAVTIGATVGLITLILDGVAAKQLADQWAAAPEPAKATALAVVSANETVNFALASLFNLSFAGIPFILFGLAVTRADARRYPRWLGWVACYAGIGSVLAGLVQALTGKPTVASLILTIVGPTVITLWMLLIGALLWRQAKAAPTQ
jgi:low temperature requirement protein LtrA